MSQPPSQPIDAQVRINHLDILRGFALLGILLMNIQSYSMPGAAYINPTAWGDLSGANWTVWLLSHLFADSKFMGLFSILFGAGVCLFADRASQRWGSATALHYKRNFWLMLFGLFHAYFIWYGDILFSYAICAFWVYWFRNRTVKGLLFASFVILSVASGYNFFVQFALDQGYIPAADQIEILGFWKPDVSHLEAEIAAYAGSFSQQLQQRASDALMMQTQVLPTLFIWRAGGMMLLGMALYKSGLLSGKKSNSFYWLMVLLGFGIGLSLSGYGVLNNLKAEFDMQVAMFAGSQFNYWGSIFVALGYIGLVNLMINNGIIKSLQARLASVGRMAFTNYIFHSLVCGFIFYGHGLGLFAQLERWQQLLVVIAIWLFQLWLSPLWLKRYRFGPLEWLWRSLTYWKVQPMRQSTNG